MKQYKLYIFDLDNTLYDEHSFLNQAYRNISFYLAQRVSLISPERFYNFLWTHFLQDGRKDLFDKLLGHFHLQGRASVKELQEVLYETAKTAYLELYPWVRDYFESLLSHGSQIAILTNGNFGQQQFKVHNLGLHKFEKNIIIYYAFQHGFPKPSAVGLIDILRQAQVSNTDAIMIGDHEVDRICSLRAGVKFMQIKDFLLSVKRES